MLKAASRTPFSLDPETPRDKLVELLGYAQRRVDRAQERKGRAERELAEAASQLDRARADIDTWDAEHPDPQMALI